MTKANLLATLNTFISAVGLVTKTRHTNANTTIVDEMYPNSVTDSQTTETYTTKFGTNIGYTLRIVKSGNVAHVQGSIVNFTGSILSPQNIFTWKDNEFKPKDDVNNLTFRARHASSGDVILFMNSNILTLISPLPTGQTFIFEFITYITQD